MYLSEYTCTFNSNSDQVEPEDVLSHPHSFFKRPSPWQTSKTNSDAATMFIYRYCQVFLRFFCYIKTTFTGIQGFHTILVKTSFSFCFFVDPCFSLQARLNREKTCASKELAQLRAIKPQTPLDPSGAYKSFTAY